MNPIPHKVAEMAKHYKFLNETAYRNYCIREDFSLFRKENKSIEEIEYLCRNFPVTTSKLHTLTGEHVESILADHHHISADRIHKIVYPGKKK